MKQSVRADPDGPFPGETALPEDGRVRRPKTHQVVERRFVEAAGGGGGGAKGVPIQEEGDEQLQQHHHQLRTWRTGTEETASQDASQANPSSGVIRLTVRLLCCLDQSLQSPEPLQDPHQVLWTLGTTPLHLLKSKRFIISFQILFLMLKKLKS